MSRDVLILESILKQKRDELGKLQKAELTEKMENMRPIVLMRKLGEYCERADKKQLELLNKLLEFSKNQN